MRYHLTLVRMAFIQKSTNNKCQIKRIFLYCWRRKWQPTPVLLPGKSHGWRSLIGYSPWGLKESDTTEATQQQQQRQDDFHFGRNTMISILLFIRCVCQELLKDYLLLNILVVICRKYHWQTYSKLVCFCGCLQPVCYHL